MADATANPSTATGVVYPDYAIDRDTFREFINEYTDVLPSKDDDNDEDEDEDEPVLIYRHYLKEIKDRECITLNIYLSELIRWDGVRGGDLASRVESNAKRYMEQFLEVVDAELEQMNVGDSVNHDSNRTASDILMDHREIRHEESQQQQARQDMNLGMQSGLLSDPFGGVVGNDGNGNGGVTNAIPAVLKRRYELHILPAYVQRYDNDAVSAFGNGRRNLRKEGKRNSGDDENIAVSLRSVRSDRIGQLVSIKGMIVRASDVKPCCLVACYTCERCGCEVYQVVKGREFMPRRKCPSSMCNPSADNGTGEVGAVNSLPTNTNRGGDTLFLQTRGSKFVKFQELKMQEIPSQVPVGHIPRCMTVHVHGDLTRNAMPGEVVTIDGIFLPARVEGGYQAIRAGLVASTYLEAMRITVHKKSYDNKESSSDAMVRKVLEIASGEDPVGRLARSIAPEIFGHEDVKRALLLQMVRPRYRND